MERKNTKEEKFTRISVEMRYLCGLLSPFALTGPCTFLISANSTHIYFHILRFCTHTKRSHDTYPPSNTHHIHLTYGKFMTSFRSHEIKSLGFISLSLSLHEHLSLSLSGSYTFKFYFPSFVEILWRFPHFSHHI